MNPYIKQRKKKKRQFPEIQNVNQTVAFFMYF